jgi:hypothetical protein
MDITVDCQRLQQSIERILTDFHQTADANQMLLQLRTVVLVFIETLVAAQLQQLLYEPGFLDSLKALAAKSAMRFKGYKATSIRLLTGQSLSICSPYFAQSAPGNRRGRKSKKRKKKTGCHLGLSYVGFFDRCSQLVASSAAQAALLCPSFDIARRTLQCWGITLNIKTIQRLCQHLGNRAIEQRQRIAISDDDTVQGRILLVSIDGGRLRERRAKRGRRPDKLQRQGYHTDWREPTQLVIQWLNSKGTKCRQRPPIYDATMGDTNQAFELLESYLRQLDISQADLVVFCADGARRYWKRFGAMAKRLAINAHLETIDYTHAKQNLNEILDRLPKKLGASQLSAIASQCKDLLWRGDIAELGHLIRKYIKGRKNRNWALSKFKNYFWQNRQRMQYMASKHLNLPTGSGCVESAIRRVINLRLKAPGTFWKRETAEVMLFLRSTLLCGRWDTMLNNLVALNRGQL